jgi:hypothetical protein
VIAAGAAGIAIGTRFPHPLAGVLGALVLFLISANSHILPAGAVWLLPWEVEQDQLGQLPGPLAGYPAAGAHAVELAGIAAAAGIAALAATVSRARPGAGWRRWHPGPGGDLLRGSPATAAHPHRRPEPPRSRGRRPGLGAACTTVSQVRYCLYPGFGRQLPSLQAPVNGVLAHRPRPA